MHPIRIFPLRPSAAETLQTPRAAHPLIEADSGRFRADPRCQGADSIPGRIVRRRGPSGRRASTLGSRCPQRAEIRGALGHLSASFEPNPRRLPGPDGPSTDSQARVALPGPQGTDTTADVPSTTVSRSQERSTQQRSADPEFSRDETRRPALWTVLPTQPGGRRSPAHPETSLPPSLLGRRAPQLEQPRGLGSFGRTPFSRTSKTGYLVHALQTTLWTCSLLFKSPTGERGKKNPEEIQVNWKKKFRKGVHRGGKSPGSTDLQTTTELSGECGDRASHPDLTRNPHTPATLLVFQAERTPTPPPGGPLPAAGQLQRLFMAFHRWRLPPTLLLAL